MGAVHRAVDLTSGELVALKTIQDDPRFVARFQREVRLLEELRHPRVVRYVDSGVHLGSPFLVMEWVDGCDLAERLSRGALDVVPALELARKLAQALGVAHARGVVHRDVKPKNVMLRDGREDAPLLTDFGVARLDAASRTLTVAGTAVGTPGFIAPEQVETASQVGPRADVFALGCTLFASLTGRNPYGGGHAFAILARIVSSEPPRLASVWPEVPPAVDALCACLMAKRPDDRPLDGEAAAKEISRCLEACAGVSAHFRPSARLGSDEARLTSAVFARMRSDVGASAQSTDGPTLFAPIGALGRAVESWVGGFGRKVTVLGPDVFAVSFDGSGAAAELATQAVACALGIAERTRDARVVVTTARGAPGDLAQLGERAREPLAEPAPDAAVTIDETTASLVSEVFSLTPGAGTFFRVSPSLTAATIEPPAPESPMFGRSRELDVLRASVDESFGEPTARVILLEGPPGIGKTRLLEELVKREELTTRGTLLVLRGPPVGVGSPLAAFDTVDTKASSGERGAALLATLGQALAEGPVALLAEDLRTWDRASVELLERLALEHRDAPLFVAVALRPADRGLHPQLLRRASPLELKLGPLPTAVAAALARSVLELPSMEELERLVSTAEGHPLHLLELARMVARGATTFPESVLAVFEARLRELPPEDRQLLRAASVFGSQFPRAGLVALLGDTFSDDLDRRLSSLVARDLLASASPSPRGAGATFTFRQALLRETAYATLTAEDRRAAHDLAAAWLETAAEAPEVVARHRALGGT
jgi:eukaryotic-like serine/threonine-protein kinase